jgi:hypothetical protein
MWASNWRRSAWCLLRVRATGLVPSHPLMPRLVVQKPVSVPVNDHPLTVLSPVDVRDAGADRRHRATPKGRRDLLEADGVGQSPTDTGGHKFKAVGRAVGKPTTRPNGRTGAPPLHSAWSHPPRTGSGDSCSTTSPSRGAGSPLQIAFSASIWRGNLGKELVHLGNRDPPIWAPRAQRSHSSPLWLWPGAPVRRELSADLCPSPRRTRSFDVAFDAP